MCHSGNVLACPFRPTLARTGHPRRLFLFAHGFSFSRVRILGIDGLLYNWIGKARQRSPNVS